MRFRLFAPPHLGAVEIEADGPEVLATAGTAARAAFGPDAYVLLQVWDGQAWRDPVYQGEPRAVVIPPGATYPPLWRDRWAWCLAAGA